MATTERKVDDSQALVKILNEAMPDLKRLAPKYVNLSRLMALALEARMRTPILAKCSIDSIVAFCKRTAEWGTDRVGAGGVWPVPFWSSKNNCYEAVAIPDWRFLIEKAKKAHAIKHATADIVREGDVFEVVRGLNPDLIHKPTGGSGSVTAAYCVYVLPDGTRDFQVMWRPELDAIRNRSNAWKMYLKDKTKTCPYNTDPEEMDKKTIVKRTMKLFEGASIELTSMLEADHLAMGFDRFGELPEPIAMPKALTATTESAEPTKEASTPQTQAPQQAPMQEQAAPLEPTKTTPTPIGPVISEAREKRLYAIARGAGRSPEGIKAVIARWGYEHTRDVRVPDYDAICAAMEEPPQTERRPGEDG